jgi:hypothetical protein
MKLLLGLLIIVVVVVAGVFAKGYFDDSVTAATLKTKIDSDSKNLTTLTTSSSSLAGDISDLKAKQAKIRAAIDNEITVVPDRINTNDIIRSLLTASQKFDCTIVPLTSTDWTSTKIMEGNYWVYHSQIKISGTQPQIINFLNYVQRSLYPTLVIEKLDMQQKILVTPVATVSASETEAASGPVPPTVSTLIATDIYYDSATLVGNLSALGDSPNTLVSFQYGEDTSYGKTTAAVSQTAPGIFSAHITGLWGPNVYHYRAVAAGTAFVFGNDVMFVTLGSTPTPTSLALPTSTTSPTGTPSPTPTVILPTADVTIAIYAK